MLAEPTRPRSAGSAWEPPRPLARQGPSVADALQACRVWSRNIFVADSVRSADGFLVAASDLTSWVCGSLRDALAGSPRCGGVHIGGGAGARAAGAAVSSAEGPARRVPTSFFRLARGESVKATEQSPAEVALLRLWALSCRRRGPRQVCERDPALAATLVGLAAGGRWLSSATSHGVRWLTPWSPPRPLPGRAWKGAQVPGRMLLSARSGVAQATAERRSAVLCLFSRLGRLLA